MRLILIQLDDGTQAYQHVHVQGYVQAYLDLDGKPIELIGGSKVIDEFPPAPAWDVPDPKPTPEPPPPPPPVRRLTKLAFVGRLGNDFVTILSAAKVNVGIEMFVKMLDWATPDPDGTSVDLDDPRVIGALQALEAGGLLAEGRAAEILG